MKRMQNTNSLMKAKSSCFGISNGTREGSVLSPAFFAVYIDDLLQRLRGLGVGCHIGEKFLGASGFADEIVLLAPSNILLIR